MQALGVGVGPNRVLKATPSKVIECVRHLLGVSSAELQEALIPEGRALHARLRELLEEEAWDQDKRALGTRLCELVGEAGFKTALYFGEDLPSPLPFNTSLLAKAVQRDIKGSASYKVLPKTQFTFRGDPAHSLSWLQRYKEVKGKVCLLYHGCREEGAIDRIFQNGFDANTRKNQVHPTIIRTLMDRCRLCLGSNSLSAPANL